MRASSASSFNDSASRETWTWRSTVGACSDDDEDYGEERGNSQESRSDDSTGSGAEEKSEDNTSSNNSAYSNSTDDNDDTSYPQQSTWNQDDGQESRARRVSREAKKPVASQAAAPKLLSIAGFSNKEALRTRLPVRRSAPTPSQPSSSSNTHRNKQTQQLQEHHGDPRTLESDRLVLKKRQYQFLQPQHLLPEQDDFQVQGKNLEHKIAMHEELTRRDKKLASEHSGSNNNTLLPQVDSAQRLAVTYRMSTAMVYSIVFTSSATLHCAIFNFSLELRRFFRLEMLPFGVFLLVCWAILGLLSFAGGWIGDLVRDRVVLLRRTAVLWALAVFVLHIAAFRAGSTFSIVLLSMALPCSCAAHGIFAPNCIVLGAERYTLLNDKRHLRTTTTTRNRRSQSTSSSQSLAGDTDADIDIVSKLDQERLDNDDEEALVNHLNVTRKMAIHKYFSRCFGATLAGSSWVQLFFFLLMDVEVPSSSSSSSPSSKKSIMGRRGFLCMLLSSLLLLAALICFVFQSRAHYQPPRAPVGSFERKLEQAHDQKPDSFSWRAVLRVFSRAFIGYVFLVALLVAFVGVCCAFFGLVFVADTSFNVRLASFFMILLGWHTAMSISKFQLSVNGKLSSKCRSLGIPMPQLQSALLLVFFFCMSSLSAFLRAQLYTTLVVQVCQTRLDIPGAGKVFNPNALGALVSVVSLLLIPISNATRFRGGGRRKAQHQRHEFRVVSISPSRRLSIGICLYLVGIFLSSIVELYRRTKVVLSDPQPQCSKAYSDFGFLWAAPHLVFLGLSDMVFRVSLQEQFHSINLLTSRWPGFMQGVIEFSEMIGYVGALALTSMLSSWLFRPSSSDLALVLLLMTTLLAFSYASLKRVAEKIAAGHLGETEGLG
ncbi:hypothetical protein Gpo141_00000116 [Globisporangium polare]